MPPGLKRTHFYSFHVGKARMGEFAGFEMPLWYEGIIPEHMAVREAVGVFDVSHMGRVAVEGPDAGAFLNYVLTSDVRALRPGRSAYSLMCNERGGIIDDVVVLRRSGDAFLLVVNAANRSKDLGWLAKHAEGWDVAIRDLSDNVAMMAVQGPRALDVVEPLCDKPVSGLKWHSFTDACISGAEVLVARMGYTGEDGFEIYIWDVHVEEPEKALRIWDAVLEAGHEFGIRPCGLGARDTLRLEAGYRLYGADMDERTTPFEAGLSFAVDLDKGDFIGREALLEEAEEGPDKVLACITLLERGVPRHGHKVLDAGGREVGWVTSGTFSPLLKCGIALAYVRPELSEPGTELLVDLRARRARALVVKPPFYDPAKYGRKRRAGT